MPVTKVHQANRSFAHLPVLCGSRLCV